MLAMDPQQEAGWRDEAPGYSQDRASTVLAEFKVESLRWSMLDFPRTLRSHLTQHTGRGPEAKVRHAGGGRFFVSERTLAVLSRISKGRRNDRNDLREGQGTQGAPPAPPNRTSVGGRRRPCTDNGKPLLFAPPSEPPNWLRTSRFPKLPVWSAAAKRSRKQQHRP